MTVINRSVISKAIFSISVVAVTASVGFVGFAQADHRDRVRVSDESEDGYGGNGGALADAIAAFQLALRNATAKFETDVASCVALKTTVPVTTTSDFQKKSKSDAATFSSETANPTAYNTEDRFDRHFRLADNDFQNRLDDDQDHLITRVESRELNRANRAAFKTCINTARKTYHNSIQTARADFRKALKNIFRG